TDEPGDDADRVLGLLPRSQHDPAGWLDPRRLQARDHERRVAVGRQHEHGETLERRPFVTGEPRQVGPERQQQRVDAELAHPGPHALDATAHGFQRWIPRIRLTTAACARRGTMPRAVAIVLASGPTG